MIISKYIRTLKSSTSPLSSRRGVGGEVWSVFLFSGLLISFCLVLSTVFAVDETLANGVVSAKYFWFYGAMGVTALVSFLEYVCRGTVCKFYPVDFLLFLFTSYVLIVNYFNSGNPFSTKWILLVQLLLLFVYFRIALQDKTLRFYLFLFFVFTGLVEAVWGLRQLYGFTPSYHNLFKLTGSFFNSGPYSGYLAVVLLWHFTLC